MDRWTDEFSSLLEIKMNTEINTFLLINSPCEILRIIRKGETKQQNLKRERLVIFKKKMYCPQIQLSDSHRKFWGQFVILLNSQG